MDKLKNWIESKAFWVKTGYRLEIANDGKSVEQKVIKLGDYYIEIMFDSETGEPVDWGWSEDPTMSHVPIREHYIAVSEQQIIDAFKASCYLNKDGDAKYWSESGDYNKTATDKFFPQEFLDEKLLPNLRKVMSAPSPQPRKGTE